MVQSLRLRDSGLGLGEGKKIGNCYHEDYLLCQLSL